MERLQAIAERVSLIGAYFGGALLLAAVFLVTFDVIARKFFSYSIAGADELSGYAYAISMGWGFVYAFHRHAHIRVELVYLRLPDLGRAVLDIVALTAFAALMLALSERAFTLLMNSVSIGSRADTMLRTPLVVPQVLWFLGLAFFVLCLLLTLTRALRALAMGELRKVQEIANGASPMQEGEEELAVALQESRGGAR